MKLWIRNQVQVKSLTTTSSNHQRDFMTGSISKYIDCHEKFSIWPLISKHTLRIFHCLYVANDMISINFTSVNYIFEQQWSTRFVLWMGQFLPWDIDFKNKSLTSIFKVDVNILHSSWAGPDSKVHGANMGPTWVLSAPDVPHVGSMNLAIRGDM